MAGNEYFNLTDENSVALIQNGELLEEYIGLSKMKQRLLHRLARSESVRPVPALLFS